MWWLCLVCVVFLSCISAEPDDLQALLMAAKTTQGPLRNLILKTVNKVEKKRIGLGRWSLHWEIARLRAELNVAKEYRELSK
jgi:hypothetical protein